MGLDWVSHIGGIPWDLDKAVYGEIQTGTVVVKIKIETVLVEESLFGLIRRWMY